MGHDDVKRKRYNVAASRARDQLWVVNSLDPANDLKSGDIRKTLIEYSLNPHASEIENDRIEKESESPFEAEVAKMLSARGYHLIQQRQVGAYRLDIVAMCENKSVAIECDGERWHSGEAKIREDMERQTILERLGWRFIRLRGSEFYCDKEASIVRVIEQLNELGVFPENNDFAEVECCDSDLLARVKQRAFSIIEGPLEEENPVDRSFVSIDDYDNSETLDIRETIQEVHQEESPSTFNKMQSAPNSEVEVLESVVKLATEFEEVSEIAGEDRRANAVVTSIESDSIIGNPCRTRGLLSSKYTETSGDMTDSKSGQLYKLLDDNDMEYFDKRAAGGALWVVDKVGAKQIIKEAKNMGFEFRYSRAGGKITGGRSAWWVRS